MPLAIKLLAGAHSGGETEELDMLYKQIKKLGKNDKYKNSKSLEECYSYSINALSDELKELLSDLTRLKSPFNKNLFESEFSRYEYPLLLDLLNRNLITDTEFGKTEEDIFLIFIQ
ncbi:MAG: hypothetical protein R2685_03955 [Candidatus Nitrosocosmicus sp.]|nr:hypothetical protein [Candidatus Nitrosocosmicus sp.]